MSAKEDSQRKTAASKPPEQALKCPRCDSPNTKFCYYNNYSLTQPRHFCKTCRRYWTKGGALRNVPIGGGCRKNKKMKPSSRISGGDSKDSSGSSEIGGFKFFHGLSPAMDFNLGGLSFPRLNPTPSSLFNQFSPFGDNLVTSAAGSTPCFSLDPAGTSAACPSMGFNYPVSSAIHDMGASMNVHSNLATSIESLSSINQDLHWKLQQQRLAMLYGGDDQKDSSVSSVPIENQQPPMKPQPILFQNLEISKPEAASGMIGNSRKDTATEWFFGNSYSQVNPTPTNSNSNGNDNAAATGGNWNNNNSNGVQGWADLHQYNGLP